MAIKSDFYQLDYIEFNSSSTSAKGSFRTDYYPNDATEISIDFMPTQKKALWRCLIGSRGSGGNNFSVYWNTGANDLAYFVGDRSGYWNDNVCPFPPLNEMANIECSCRYVKLNGVEYATETNVMPSASPNNVWLFGCGDDYSFYGRIFETKIYENGELVRDYVPAMEKATNRLFYYDRVNDEVAEASNQSYFTFGEIVYDEIQPIQEGGSSMAIGEMKINSMAIGELPVLAAYMGDTKVFSNIALFTNLAKTMRAMAYAFEEEEEEPNASGSTDTNITETI